jgi:hypothetical protein
VPPLNAQFDEKAAQCICLAKRIARHEGEKRLAAVHVVKAVVLAFPEEAALGLGVEANAWPEALGDLVIPEDESLNSNHRMPVTSELAAIVRRVSVGGQVVSLDRLIQAILSEDSIRVTSLIRQFGQRSRLNARDHTSRHIAARGYTSRRDWLADLHAEWKLRKAAARACGLVLGFGGDDQSHSRPYIAEGALDALIRFSRSIREKAKTSPTELDPLKTLSADLDPLAKRICEGIVVNEVYGLDIHPYGGLSVREVAQMLAPEEYPANCRQVVAAVDQLKEQGLVCQNDPEDSVLLAERMQLSEEFMERILDDLATDRISGGEVKAMQRLLHHDAAWYEHDARKAI